MNPERDRLLGLSGRLIGFDWFQPLSWTMRQQLHYTGKAMKKYFAANNFAQRRVG